MNILIQQLTALRLHGMASCAQELLAARPESDNLTQTTYRSRGDGATS
jgi:hypothetical protein